MASSDDNLVLLKQIQTLIYAVQDYAQEIQEVGSILQGASDLCKKERQNDTLSVAYASILDKHLGDLATNVFPKLNDLLDGLIEEEKRLIIITQV